MGAIVSIVRKGISLNADGPSPGPWASYSYIRAMFRGALTVLLLRLGLVAGLYTLLRFLFVLHNGSMFPDVPASAYLGGVRFDLFAIAWLNLPWVFLFLLEPQPGKGLGRIQLWVFLTVNAVGLFFNTVDVAYYAFTLKRSTADLLSIIGAGGDILNLAPAFVQDYWYLLLGYLGSLAILAWAYLHIGKLQINTPGPWSKPIFWRVMAVSLLLLAIRGGTQLIPLQPMDAAHYGGPSYMPVVLNTPYTMLKSFGKPTLVERQYMPQEEADALWPVVHHYQDQHHTPMEISTAAQKPNVVIIILESFSAVYSARLGGSEGYMPFLDSLMGQGLDYTRAYANGRRSIDGIPAILASMPELMDEAFITSAYAGVPFTSLASLLVGEGYTTSFYHGGRNGTMGFDGFTRSAGFQRYVGMDEYPHGKSDHDGNWGIRDRPFLQFWATALEKEQQPFLSTLFTLSSHHPYQLPPQEAERFAGGTQPIHPTLRYADDALRQFFVTAQGMPWFDNTVFVITADHTADLERTAQRSDKAIDYWVPLLFYAPGKIVAGEDDRVTQHIDILPTVLDVIGYTKPFFSIGHSALRDGTMECAFWSNNGVFSMTTEDRQLQFDGERVIGIQQMDGNDDTSKEGKARIEKLELHLKAAIQQFNGHLISGELTAEPTAR